MKQWLRFIVLALVAAIYTNACTPAIAYLPQAGSGIPSTTDPGGFDLVEQGYRATGISEDEVRALPGLRVVNHSVDLKSLGHASATKRIQMVGMESDPNPGIQDVKIVGYIDNPEEKKQTFIVSVDGVLVRVEAIDGAISGAAIADSRYSVQWWGRVLWGIAVAAAQVAVRWWARAEARRAAIAAARQIGSQMAHKARLPIQDTSKMGHIFRNAPGHLSNTPYNRTRIESAVRREYYQGRDRWGNDIYLKDDVGGQIWVEAQGGAIRNAGLNGRRRMLDPEQKVLMDFSDDGFIIGVTIGF